MGKASLKFSMFGKDSGPQSLPLTLPRSVASYFMPPYFAGGIDLIRSLDLPLGVLKIAFQGSETITLHAQPTLGRGQAKDFTLRFAGGILRADHDAFPVEIILTGSESAVVTVREPDGTNRVITLSFPFPPSPW